MNIKRITIIGANGTMGCNIAGIFAAFGNCEVYMVGRKKEAVQKAVEKVILSVKGDAIASNLIPKDYSDLEECIQNSELIFESTAENLEVKKEINQIISEVAKEDQIICTGTSGLSIEKLAEYLPEKLRKKYLGVHFFNPPYNMTLCEIIPSKYTDSQLVCELREYMERVLVRTTVEIKDKPAFLGNRIGFQFINEAMQYAEKYKYNGGIDYIDAILGQFTGRSMPPIATADFVGLDVHKAIVDNIYSNTSDYAKETFVLPEYVENIIGKGLLGKKTGKGLYQTIRKENGECKRYVYDILKDKYRKIYTYNFPFVEEIIQELRVGNYKKAVEGLKSNQSLEANICKGFLVRYVVYALVTTDKVGENISDADDVMATGFNWIPPLAVIEAFGGAEEFRQQCSQYFAEELAKKLELERLISQVKASKYDYRRYLKAKH